jgi:aryl-phospho-beta-D-glucosidase BglC (GH1 family)
MASIAASLLFALGCARDDAPEPAALSRLRADGVTIVDASGAPVRLRGVNLGAWSFHETWISLFDYPLHGRVFVVGQELGLEPEVTRALQALGPDKADDLDAVEQAVAQEAGADAAAALRAEVERYPSLADDSDLPLRLALEQRFGTDGRDRLLDTFQGAWLRDADLDWLAAQGFNLLRVPLGYRALVTTSDLEPLTELRYNELMFARIDDLLARAEARGMYVVLDLQESPGGHNDYSGVGTLYDDPAMQALTVSLWSELSGRYADRDVVAAYSLLAEPMSAPDAATRDAMYDQLVQAIRGRGDDHLLVIHDGFQGMSSLPEPAAYGWDGVVYSTHLFEWGATSSAAYDVMIALTDVTLTEAQAAQGVPYFIGSFSTMADEDWAYEGVAGFVDLFEARDWSWAVWTFKRIDDPIDAALWGTSTSWGVLGRLDGAFDRPDAWRDDEATLTDKLAGYADLDVAPNQELIDALAPGARALAGASVGR